MLRILLSIFILFSHCANAFDNTQNPMMAAAQGQTMSQSATTQPQAQQSPDDMALPSLTKEKQQSQEEYSELAFGSGSNTSTEEHSSNIQLNQEKNFGTFLDPEKKPFGYQLFQNQCGKLAHLRFLNPDYRITVGDKINIQIWGAFQFTKEMTVDTQGNIFLPDIGPIKLQGVENKNLNATLKRHMEKVFLKDVHIYGDLVTAQPVQVYVTGFVNQPGLYNGLSSDSVIFYLCQAGGINPKEGSFRNIKVVRLGKTIHDIDLYHFITAGKANNFQLHQGDTIFVGPLKKHVSVSGNVKSSYQFELKDDEIDMRKLLSLAHPDPNVTHVRIEKHQGLKPKVSYLPISQAKYLRLQSGDNLMFTSDQSQNQVIVTVTGEVVGPHQFVLKNGDSLDGLLRQLEFSKEADMNSIQLFRSSVAKQQKMAVESSLSRLERQALTSSSVTADGAKMQAFQAQMLSHFIQQARHVKFQGQVVLGPQSQWNNIHLANNDVINIPRKTSVVTISGEVMNAVSMEIEPGKTYQDYIADAGGFTQTADKNKILLVHQNGRTDILKQTLFGRKNTIIGGDQIIVLSQPQSENWQITESLTQILYRIAVAARVAVLL